jgi:hypothetical protein
VIAEGGDRPVIKISDEAYKRAADCGLSHASCGAAAERSSSRASHTL